jgi:hypothetical protein
MKRNWESFRAANLKAGTFAREDQEARDWIANGRPLTIRTNGRTILLSAERIAQLEDIAARGAEAHWKSHPDFAA